MISKTILDCFNAGLTRTLGGQTITDRAMLDGWITVHPNGAGTKGVPVLLGPDGTVQGGMGGKFNGQHISQVGGGGGNTGKTLSEVHSGNVNIGGGSEKQNSWANDIVKNKIGEYDKYLSKLHAQRPGTSKYAVTESHHSEMKELVELVNKTPSKTIIEKRNLPATMMLQSLRRLHSG